MKLIATILFMLLSIGAWAQNSVLTAKVVNRSGRMPIAGAAVSVECGGTTLTAQTDENGVFELNNVPEGICKVSVSASGFQASDMSAKVVSGKVDLGYISLVMETIVDPFADVTEDMDTEVDESSSTSTLSLSASKDIFSSIANYKFGDMRFNERGGVDNEQVYVNGILMNDAINGRGPWSLFTGLNDAVRNQETINGSGILDYGVGGINGSTQINVRASQIRAGFRSSIASSAATYRLRLMATYSTGMMDNGWAIAASVSTRQGGNNWVEGVYYNAWGYFFSVEKKLAENQSLALTVLGAPTERGAQAASTQEVYDLLGNNYYNPNWGYQKGDKRNARVRKNHEPVVMLNYYNDLSDKVKMQAAVSYRFGKNGYSGLDWYDAPDPRPDYYRNLPSYYQSINPNYNDPLKANQALEGWMTDDNIRHINWERLYAVNGLNMETVENANGVVGRTVTGKRSKYVIEERHTDQREWNAKLMFSVYPSSNVSINAGLEGRLNRTELYKEMKDLLGGDFWLNIDKYAEREYGRGNEIQNDLNNPNGIVRKGDRYDYNYEANIQSGKVWGSARMSFGELEAYFAAEAGTTRFWREGKWDKGLFPMSGTGEVSYGESDKKDFFTYTGKLGLIYKINRQHQFAANVAYLERAPYFQNSYVSPRSRNTMLEGLTTEKIFSGDVTYRLNVNDIKLRSTLFYSTRKDCQETMSFYYDVTGTFANLVMNGVDRRHYGVEIGFEMPTYILPDLYLRGAFAGGEYTYTSNPLGTMTIDSKATAMPGMDKSRVYWKDYKVEGTPQVALNVGLNYRSYKIGYAGIDLNYYSRNYLDMSPVRRMDMGITDLEQHNNLVRQERFDEAFVLNANVGKSWSLYRKYTLGFTLEVKNILNTQDIKTGGYEQMRISDSSNANGVTVVSPFDSKYFYMFGTTYNANIYFRF